MQRILLFCSLAVLFAGSIAWTRPAPQAGAAGADEARFTGKTEALENEGAAVTRRRFETGARTAWHSHPQGQTLYVTEGVARVQDRGGPVEEIRAGETVVTEAEVWHWHGAAPDQFMTHLAVYEGAPEWGDLVSDEEYGAAAE